MPIYDEVNLDDPHGGNGSGKGGGGGGKIGFEGLEGGYPSRGTPAMQPDPTRYADLSFRPPQVSCQFPKLVGLSLNNSFSCCNMVTRDLLELKEK